MENQTRIVLLTAAEIRTVERILRGSLKNRDSLMSDLERADIFSAITELAGALDSRPAGE